MKLTNSLLVIFLLIFTGCSVTKESLTHDIKSYFKSDKEVTTADKEKEKTPPKEKDFREQAGTIHYEATMAKIEAKRAAERSKWSQPLHQDFTTYLFESGGMTSHLWLYVDGRYAMRTPDMLKGNWNISERILSLTSIKGAKWIFKKLPSGTYESTSDTKTYLIPIKK